MSDSFEWSCKFYSWNIKERRRWKINAKKSEPPRSVSRIKKEDWTTNWYAY